MLMTDERYGVIEKGLPFSRLLHRLFQDLRFFKQGFRGHIDHKNGPIKLIAITATVNCAIKLVIDVQFKVAFIISTFDQFQNAKTIHPATTSISSALQVFQNYVIQ